MEKVQLQDLTDIYLGVTHTPQYVFEGVPFLSVKDISGGEIRFDDCKYISKEEYESLSEGAKPKAGDMLFCRVGTLGKPIIIPKGTPLFGTFVSLGYLRNKDEDRVDLKYLRYWMYSKSFWNQVDSNVKGASQVNLNSGWLKKFVVELPEMSEQKYRINVLDKCNAVIEKRREELSAFDNLIKARFVEIMDTSELSDETTIAAITERVKVGFVGTCEKYYTDDSGIPMLRTGNITEKGIDLHELKYVTEEFHKKNIKSQIHFGDLLIARHGSNGQANVYEGPDAQCLNAVVIVPDRKKVTSVFLAGLINSPDVKMQIERTLVGSTQHVVNTKSIASLKVRIPDPSAQAKYEEFVRQVDKSKVV